MLRVFLLPFSWEQLWALSVVLGLVNPFQWLDVGRNGRGLTWLLLPIENG